MVHSWLSRTARKKIHLAPPRIDGLVEDGPGYDYYRGTQTRRLANEAQAIRQSQKILAPTLFDPNFLVYRVRTRIIARWAADLPRAGLCVLDVGGRLQPYRPLIQDKLQFYVAIDPTPEGLLDVVAVGENLPFRSDSFHLVICTQVLNYTSDPGRVIGEIRRVLRPNGALFLSVPAIFPRYHDQRWRFMPNGLSLLLSGFSRHEIVPEGGSIAGMFRLLNLFLEVFVLDTRAHSRGHELVESCMYPMLNTAGALLDPFSGRNTRFATNYSCRAIK